MAIATQRKSNPVVSLLDARTKLGKLLDRVEESGQSVVIEKRGVPRAVLLSVKEYVRLAAPEPEILRAIGEESLRNRTDGLGPREIEAVIRKTRAARKKR